MIRLKQLLKESFSKEKWSFPINMDLTMKKLTILFVALVLGQIGVGILLSSVNQAFPSLSLNYMLINIAMNLFMVLLIPIIYSHKAFIQDFFSNHFLNSKAIQSGIFYGFVAILVNLLVGALLFYIYSVL